MSWSRRWSALRRPETRSRYEGATCTVNEGLPGCDSGPLEVLTFVGRELVQIVAGLRSRDGA